KQEMVVQGEVEERSYTIPYNARMSVFPGDEVIAGQELTEGSVDPKELLKVQGVEGVQEYLLREVQRVSRMPSSARRDKHVEVMVRQMIRNIPLIESGDTQVPPC